MILSSACRLMAVDDIRFTAMPRDVQTSKTLLTDDDDCDEDDDEVESLLASDCV